MALADLNRCKRYLRKRKKDVSDDELITELLASAKSMINVFLLMLSGERETALTPNTWPTIRSLRRDNDTGSAGTTTVTPLTLDDLITLPNYTVIEPALNQDLVDIVAHLYRNRSPNASSEAEGGGISEGWDDVGQSGLPKRVERRLRNLIGTLQAA
jgi:hypothetical protein